MALIIGKPTDIKDSVSRKAQPMFWSVIWQFVEGRILGEGQQNCLKSKNYTGNNLLGLYVSRHSTFRMGSATLIERERETGKEREKLLQTRA